MNNQSIASNQVMRVGCMMLVILLTIEAAMLVRQRSAGLVIAGYVLQVCIPFSNEYNWWDLTCPGWWMARTCCPEKKSGSRLHPSFTKPPIQLLESSQPLDGRTYQPWFSNSNSTKKKFYRLNVIFWIVMGCGIARFGDGYDIRLTQVCLYLSSWQSLN